MKILVCGLSGTGKTHLARVIANYFDAIHFDADVVRTVNNDWDFSMDGRIRQALNMWNYCKRDGITVCSFIAPTQSLRHIFDADITIWCNGTPTRSYPDTEEIFEPPKDAIEYNFNHEQSGWVISKIKRLI